MDLGVPSSQFFFLFVCFALFCFVSLANTRNCLLNGLERKNIKTGEGVNLNINSIVELNIRYYIILIFSDKIFHCYPAEAHFVLLVSKTVKMRTKTITFGK